MFMNPFGGGLCLDESGADLLRRLLHMDPTQRITAPDALKVPWLTTQLPKPTHVDMMPKFQSRDVT